MTVWSFNGTSSPKTTIFGSKTAILASGFDSKNFEVKSLHITRFSEFYNLNFHFDRYQDRD